MGTVNDSTSHLLKTLHTDLKRKYVNHGSKIEEIWRSFSPEQRVMAFKAGAADGVVLKHPNDHSLGRVSAVIPELNLRDIAGESADYFLDHLKHRATKTLSEQYREGVSGGKGDHLFILDSMHVNNLRHSQSFRNSFTNFIDEDDYGKSYTAAGLKEYQEVMKNLAVAVNAGLCVPQATGELILERQTYFLQSLNILIEDILDLGSTSRDRKKRPQKPEEAARTAFSNLSFDSKPEKASLQDIIAAAQDQKSSLEVYLDLCRTEPVFLAHAVNIWFFTRPELVPDERGRRLPQATDKYISPAFLEVIHNAVLGTAIWNFLHDLLKILADAPNDRVYRGIILQEISSICQFEYDRVQKAFKCYVQMGIGSKHFKRLSNVFDNGAARVALKTKPDTLTRDDPQLHYILRLCQTETKPSQAVAWINKLSELHQRHPIEQDKMEERELDAFGDLAVTVSFIQSLSVSLQLPSFSPKKGQLYVSKLKLLAAELDTLKTEIDLTNYVAPIDNLLEPAMAETALNALDEFIYGNAGTPIGFLYQDLNEESLSQINRHLQQAKEAGKAAVEELTSFTSSKSEDSDPEIRVKERRQKYKTRPTHLSAYNITSTTSTPPTGEDEKAFPTVFKVKPNTYEVFSTLFSRSESRGSITWLAFGAAMIDLKFSIVPKFGSVFTFLPPQDLGVQKSFTVHRPHQSRIEGYSILYFASRLKRLFGWGEQTFEAT